MDRTRFPRPWTIGTELEHGGFADTHSPDVTNTDPVWNQADQ